MEKCFHVCYLVVFLILVGSTSSEGQKVLLFFFSFKMFLVFRVEGAVKSWVGWARFQPYGVLESQFFTS